MHATVRPKPYPLATTKGTGLPKNILFLAAFIGLA